VSESVHAVGAAAGSPATAEPRLGFSTRAIHDARVPEFAEEPAALPLWLASDYLFEGVEHYADVLNERRDGFAYARYESPTHAAYHAALASLEGAEAAFSFASGMAAVLTTLTSLASAGDHVVAQRGVYNTTRTLIESFLPRFGVTSTLVGTEAEDVAGALRPETVAVVVDSIATPTFRVSDVEGIAALCHERGVRLVVDNTIATPYLLRPLEIPGVTLVLHSASKYIGGHSDLIGGAVAGPRELVEPIHRLTIQQGTISGVFDAWLAARGLQTLALRVERQCENALVLARALVQQPEVARVGYSGLPDHPDHARARTLFGGRFGAMLSIDLVGGFDAVCSLCRLLRLARVGSGFGGVRSEVRHPASTGHRHMTPAQREEIGIGDDMLRISVGAEDADDLVTDFVQALERMSRRDGSS